MEENNLQFRMKQIFTEGFTAIDIAKPLFSFDADKSALQVRQFMKNNHHEVVAIRNQGQPIGYIQLKDLRDGICQDYIHQFNVKSTLSQQASYRDVINCLAQNPYCFITTLGEVNAIITRGELQQVPVRMWLFGMISIIEIFLVRQIQEKYPYGSWQGLLSESRLEKAKNLQQEKERRNQKVDLFQCLQLTDKARILMTEPNMRMDAGFESKRDAEKAISDIESLRNNLAHASDLITYDWDIIVNIAQRLDKLMTRI